LAMGILVAAALAYDEVMYLFIVAGIAWVISLLRRSW